MRSDDESTVGYLWLRVRPLATEVEAFVFDVEIVAQERGRGLGRATMLAAEAAARSRDATVMRLNVFAHNAAARALYDSLGYAVEGAVLTKRLDPAPPSPGGPSVRLRPMTEQQYVDLRPALEADHAADIVRSGVLPAAEAVRKAADDLHRLLPQGPATPGHRLWTAYDDPDDPDDPDRNPVGHLWVQLQERSDGLHAFGYDFVVREEWRGQGYGRAVLHAAEQACRALGATSAGQAVSGFNEAANARCAHSGFELAAQTLVKPLRPVDAAPQEPLPPARDAAWVPGCGRPGR